MSVRAARPVSAMVVNARVAAAGSDSETYRPPSAWAMITESEWATMSCISRAMRDLSAAVAICACWSRSISSRRVRSRSPSMISRRDRRTRPKANTLSEASATAAVTEAAPTRSPPVPEKRRRVAPSSTPPVSAPMMAVRYAQTGP